jgi:hypothetical protein
MLIITGHQPMMDELLNAVKRAKMWFPIQTFATVCSVLLRTIHNSGPLWAFPHFSRCAPGKNLNFIEYFMYLLHYRACFWVFVLDGMTLRLQRCQFLCPVFPESRYWDVRPLGVHSSSPFVCFFISTVSI